jgi:hypothetical protein
LKKTLIFAAFLLASFTGLAQKDHTSQSGFLVDSLSIRLLHWHTQSAAQDTIKYASVYVWKYFSIKNDTLYAQLPRGYTYYEVDNPLSGGRDNDKTMVTVQIGNTTRWFRVSDLIGRTVAICTTKNPAIVYLSL